MTEEPSGGEVQEGVLWFVTQVQAIVRWLWTTIFGQRQR